MVHSRPSTSLDFHSYEGTCLLFVSRRSEIRCRRHQSARQILLLLRKSRRRALSNRIVIWTKSTRQHHRTIPILQIPASPFRAPISKRVVSRTSTVQFPALASFLLQMPSSPYPRTPRSLLQHFAIQKRLGNSKTSGLSHGRPTILKIH